MRSEQTKESKVGMKNLQPKPTSFQIKVEDCGGYFQIYLVQHGMEAKLANLYPPGFELFGEVQDPQYWTLDKQDGGRKLNYRFFNDALCSLMRQKQVSP